MLRSSEHPLDQHQLCLSSVYLLSGVPAQKVKKTDNLCSGTAFCTCWPQLKEEVPSLLAFGSQDSVCPFGPILVQVSTCDIVGGGHQLSRRRPMPHWSLGNSGGGRNRRFS